MEEKKKSEESIFYLKQLTGRATPYNVELCGIKLRIDYGVYPADDIGKLFNKALNSLDWSNNKIQLVLDYGTGSGFLAIQAVKLGAGKVIASEVSQYAVDCAKYNLTVHDVNKHIELRHGDGFDVIKEDETFNIIMASLPWENAKPDKNVPLEQAFYDPEFKMRKDLFRNAKNHLSQNGHIFFSYSRKAQQRNPIEDVIQDDYTYKIVENEKFEDDEHYLYDITPKM